MVGGSLQLRPYASLVKDVKIFLGQRSMILQHKLHRPRVDEVGGRSGCWGLDARVYLQAPTRGLGYSEKRPNSNAELSSLSIHNCS